jgi:hypothetical protein
MHFHTPPRVDEQVLNSGKVGPSMGDLDDSSLAL